MPWVLVAIWICGMGCPLWRIAHPHDAVQVTRLEAFTRQAECEARKQQYYEGSIRYPQPDLTKPPQTWEEDQQLYVASKIPTALLACIHSTEKHL
jgi:hypothetical protein